MPSGYSGQCQSVTNIDGRPSGFACTYNSTAVLAGVHVCGHHVRFWTPRLERGQKIRVHPERALPLDHTCPNAPLPPCVLLHASAREANEPSGGPIPCTFVHEVVCLHCGRRIGDVRTTDSAPVAVPGVRCQHCDGPPIFSGEVTRELAIERDLFRGWQPQRGQPPGAAGAA